MRIRVKICGITRVEDALAAAEAGADAIGLVFARSPRRVDLETARRIVAALPPMVSAVGVFVDAAVEEVRETAREAGLHAVQLHGAETAEYAGALAPIKVIKAVSIASAGDVRRAAAFPGAVLLDAATPHGRGGAGETFDWRLAADLSASKCVILAGGLRAGNVAEAIRVVRPWGVDVSSAVESSPGVKDALKVAEFVSTVRRCAVSEN